MEIKKDSSVGIVPVYKGESNTYSFCLVHHTEGHWAFPKGHIDAGESKEAAARRELFEETGIAICMIDETRAFTEKYSFVKDGVHFDKEVTYVVGFVAEKVPVAPIAAFKGEISEARWVSYYEAKELLSYPESVKIMDDVCAYMKDRKS